MSPKQKKKSLWRPLYRETGLLEWTCEHGVGHADEDSAQEIADKYGHKIDTWLVHGCDGCCEKADFPGKKIGVKNKKELINKWRKENVE